MTKNREVVYYEYGEAEEKAKKKYNQSKHGHSRAMAYGPLSPKHEWPFFLLGSLSGSPLVSPMRAHFYERDYKKWVKNYLQDCGTDIAGYQMKSSRE